MTMMTFQAKDIRSILNLPKHRYDYILMKIGIVPEIEQASGRGKTNLFSFANLLDFAISNTSMNIGMTPEMIRAAIGHIHQSSLNYYSTDFIGEPLSYHIGADNNFSFYCFSGEVPDSMTELRIFKYPKNYSQDTHKLPYDDFSEGALDFDKIAGFCTLNLTFIKDSLLDKM